MSVSVEGESTVFSKSSAIVRKKVEFGVKLRKKVGKSKFYNSSLLNKISYAGSAGMYVGDRAGSNL